MQVFKMAGDINGKPIEGAVPICDAVYFRPTTANTPVNITVPTGAGIALFNSPDRFWLALGSGNAAVPSSSSDAASEFLPVARLVSPGQVLSLITEINSSVYVSFYSTWEILE